MKLIVVAMAVYFVLSLIACRKYNEDDRRYLKTPCGRIAKKWQLYKITDKNGVDYSQRVIKYASWPNQGIPNSIYYQVIDSFQYVGMILEFDKIKNLFCLETGLTGLRGNVKCTNKPYSSGYYNFLLNRTKLKFDIRPNEHTNTRYFINDYTVFKMTSDELIFGNDYAKAYFRIAD